MSVTGKLTAGFKAGLEGLTDGTIITAGWVALATTIGVVGVGLHRAYVDGAYDGDLIEQGVQGIKSTIPFLSDLPVLKTISRDLSGAAVALVSYVTVRTGIRAKNAMSKEYTKQKEYSEEKDEIKRDGDKQIYRIDQADRVYARQQRSPTQAG